MNNVHAALRSLIIYAICIVLAITMGYLLTNPLTYSTFGVLGIVGLILSLPLLLRWHYPLLLFAWYTNITLFFIKGTPTVWLALVALSLAISIIHCTLNKDVHFIHVPQITWPLVCIIGIVLVTAELTGGFGLRSFGSEIYGGKKYVFLLVGILSYFALTARSIPPERVKLFVSLFFLGGTLAIIGDLFPLIPSSLQFIFWLFPPSVYTSWGFQLGETRLGGFSTAGLAVLCWLLAVYGIRGVFFSKKVWRQFLFALSFVMIFLGGFRSAILEFGAIFTLVFFLEKLHRSKLFWVFLSAGVLMGAALIPLAPHLPYTFQRTLSFLPLNVDAAARQNAQATLNWRLRMWKALLPQVPHHLLLGKGFGFKPEDYEMMVWNTPFQAANPGQQGAALAFDYHNGPLSVVLPFGIWGALAFLWFMAASLRVTYCNFRYGDPSLRIINTFLWADLLFLFGNFLFLGGAFSSDMMHFIGPLGLSIALNGGVCHPSKSTSPDFQTEKTPETRELQPSPAG